MSAAIGAGLRYGALGLPLAFVALPLYVVLPNHYAEQFGVPLAALAALLLLALALTSPKRAVQLLGAQQWQRLHHSIHAAAWLALLHFYWMRLGKNQWAEVAVYAAIVAALQGWRIRSRRMRGKA